MTTQMLLGQSCLDVYQLERMLGRTTSYSDINNFLVENDYDIHAAGSTTIVLDEDSIKTSYFRNSNYGSFVSVHNKLGSTHRIIEYRNSDCSYLITSSLVENNYTLISDNGIQEFRNGSTHVMIYPDGLVVFYGKEIADLRLSAKKLRAQKLAVKARIEAEFIASVNLYKAKLEIYRNRPDSSDYYQLLSKFNGAVREDFKSRGEFVTVRSDLLSLWRIHLDKQVDLLVNEDLFDQALSLINSSSYPILSIKEDLTNVVIDKRLRHEIANLFVMLGDAQENKNYAGQIEISNQIIAHPRATADQVINASQVNKKALESLQFISKRKGDPLAYWEQARQIKVQVEQVLHEHLLNNLSKRSKGNFDFSMRIIFDTLGVNNSMYNLSSEDRELKSTIDKLLKPVILSGLYFSAADTLFISSSWYTERLKVKSNYRGIDFSKSNIWNDDIRTLISNSPSKCGIFNFKIQQVTVNGMSNSRVSYVDHRVGSSVISNLVKSVILPGWGRRRVNFGKPNKKFGEIMLIGSSAFGAEFYAQSLLSAYERDPSRDDLFADAEMWHRISLGLAAVGALDYLNEQGFVLIKSFRNIGASRRTDKMNKNWTRTNIMIGKR